MVVAQAVRERLRLSLWFVPMLFAAGAIALALVLAAVDRGLASDPGALRFLYTGTADGARSVLSTIAESMLTFTALVFTITMLVLQLASSQLSPRVMRTFLGDRANQMVLGLFVATFVYTLIVLREVRAPVDGDPGFVPGLSIWMAFVLLLASVGAFVYYINHMAHAIRASSVIANIWQETVSSIDHVFRDVPDPRLSALSDAPAIDRPPEHVVTSTGTGVVVAVDDRKLLELAHGDRVLEVMPAVGDFVPEGSPIARLWGQWDRDAAGDVREAVGLGNERTLDEDPTFGFRQLVDVAVRALSPGTNDPTTAVQALDRIHDLLRRLVVRELPSPLSRDRDGTVRLVRRRAGWNDFVALGLDEIRLAGKGQIQINRRLRAILDDLSSVAPDDRRAVLRHQLSRIDAGLDEAFDDPGDRATAATPSERGHAQPTPPEDR